jgi:hypothetical protein
MNWMQKEWKSFRNWAESATFVMPSWRRVIAMKKRAGIPKFPRNPAQTTFIIISINSLTHTLVSFHSPSDIHALLEKWEKFTDRLLVPERSRDKRQRWKSKKTAKRCLVEEPRSVFNTIVGMSMSLREWEESV